VRGSGSGFLPLSRFGLVILAPAIGGVQRRKIGENDLHEGSDGDGTSFGKWGGPRCGKSPDFGACEWMGLDWMERWESTYRDVLGCTEVPDF
jgi:hypothetical protein